MVIEMERNLLIDEGNQWTWHKSWNLPNISITLDVTVTVVMMVVDKGQGFRRSSATTT